MERIDADELTALWTLATVTDSVGDLLTTMTVASAATAVTEANPVVRAAFKLDGLAGFVVLLCALAIGVRAARADDWLRTTRPRRSWPSPGHF